MIPVLLIVIPLVSGLIAFLLKSERGARGWALLSSLITLVVMLWGLSVPKGQWPVEDECGVVAGSGEPVCGGAGWAFDDPEFAGGGELSVDHSDCYLAGSVYGNRGISLG
jgi:hypothetical protein